MQRHVQEFARLVTDRRRELFVAGRPVAIARAPGRLDVMGGIADYSGSLVLETPIGEAVLAAAQLRDDGRVRIVSEIVPSGAELCADLDEGALPWCESPDYEAVRQALARAGVATWTYYVVGALAVLWREKLGRGPIPGASIYIRSTVPTGVGVASSAALTVAVMHSLSAVLGLTLEPLELARLCQVAENRVAGVPCGIMDQVTIALGRNRDLLIILCQPHSVVGHVRLPDNVVVCGIDSGVEKSTGGLRYRKARVAAFMGKRILADHVPGLREGYLANVQPSDFMRLRRLLPKMLRGADFIEAYGTTGDPVTSVDPTTLYSVRGCTEHPIYENHRVARFVELVREGGERSLREAGRLMYASNWSYTYRCGLGHPDTNLLVRLAREAGPYEGIYGAKITGGGAGGTVAILARADAVAKVVELAEHYRSLTVREPRLFTTSSPGAVQSGITFVRP